MPFTHCLPPSGRDDVAASSGCGGAAQELCRLARAARRTARCLTESHELIETVAARGTAILIDGHAVLTFKKRASAHGRIGGEMNACGGALPQDERSTRRLPASATSRVVSSSSVTITARFAKRHGAAAPAGNAAGVAHYFKCGENAVDRASRPLVWRSIRRRTSGSSRLSQRLGKALSP